MDDSQDRQTAQQARAALDEAAARRIDSPRDRRVHGLATALVGIVLGVFVAVARREDPSGAAMIVLATALIAIVAWQASAARSTPRWARLISVVGIGVTVVVMIVSMGLAAWHVHVSGPLSVPLLALLALVVALPLAVTGGIIAARSPR